MRFLHSCRIRAPPHLLNLAASREKNQVFTKARYLDKSYRFGFPMPRGSQKYQTRHGAAANLGSYCWKHPCHFLENWWKTPKNSFLGGGRPFFDPELFWNHFSRSNSIRPIQWRSPFFPPMFRCGARGSQSEDLILFVGPQWRYKWTKLKTIYIFELSVQRRFDWYITSQVLRTLQFSWFFVTWKNSWNFQNF